MNSSRLRDEEAAAWFILDYDADDHDDIIFRLSCQQVANNDVHYYFCCWLLTIVDYSTAPCSPSRSLPQSSATVADEGVAQTRGYCELRTT